MKRMIRTYRERKGYTQRRLAGMVGVSEVTVSQWESGVRTPSSRILPALSSALGCKIDDLYEPEDRENSGPIIRQRRA